MANTLPLNDTVPKTAYYKKIYNVLIIVCTIMRVKKKSFKNISVEKKTCFDLD
jgi:hypothetical protein